MEFVGAHGLLELRPLDDLAHEGVGIEEDIVGEEDVVDADDAVIAQDDVVEEGGTGEEFHAEAVVEVVVEVRAGGDDPVHEARFHQRDDGGGAEAGGGQRAGERQADGAVVGEHLVDVKSGRLRRGGRRCRP